MGEAVRSFLSRLDRVKHEVAKSGVVGAFGFVVNFLVFLGCKQLLHLEPGRSSVVSTAVAILFNYVGIRFWTYGHRENDTRGREFALYLGFSFVGMILELIPVMVVNYILHASSTPTDMIAKFGVGLPMATLFRLFAYRTWVFTDNGSRFEERVS
ncbi:GtrA family protein [Streptomyces sp. SID3343]|uniref:GtrA family protein n=1 Tax=Streptomyces sp. SID3343 TaxID=2690260 RepID=UPI00136F093B|nr:GtrA family protein [Streptomyces sp. SID3343]MYW01008.1 GtrA family protein [Streptomyces sp. SID3343]